MPTGGGLNSNKLIWDSPLQRQLCSYFSWSGERISRKQQQEVNCRHSFTKWLLIVYQFIGHRFNKYFLSVYRVRHMSFTKNPACVRYCVSISDISVSLRRKIKILGRTWDPFFPPTNCQPNVILLLFRKATHKSAWGEFPKTSVRKNLPIMKIIN